MELVIELVIQDEVGNGHPSRDDGVAVTIGVPVRAGREEDAVLIADERTGPTNLVGLG
jgi:hypothetical protein